MGVQLEQRAGGEVRVETGRGIIVELGAAGKRNRQVKIRATHADLKELVTGWLDTDNAEAAAFIVEAHRERREVAYRVEVKRKDGADPATPIAELGNRDKVRDLVSVVAAAGGADTPPDEVPATPAQEPAPPPQEDRPGPEPGAAASGPENATEGASSGDQSERRRGKVAEGKLWEASNTDGSINVGSYATQAAAGMVELAVDVLTREGGPPPAPAKVQGLARVLLHAADEIQAGARNDGHADRMATSHARARGVLRTALGFYPVPLGASDEERAEWQAALIGYGVALLRIAARLGAETPERER